MEPILPACRRKCGDRPRTFSVLGDRSVEGFDRALKLAPDFNR
jgi:hypothetical protein